MQAILDLIRPLSCTNHQQHKQATSITTNNYFSPASLAQELKSDSLALVNTF